MRIRALAVVGAAAVLALPASAGAASTRSPAGSVPGWAKSSAKTGHGSGYVGFGMCLGWRDASGFDEGKLVASVATTFGASMPGRFDLAATRLDQETAGFIVGKDAYRDEDLRESNPNPEAFRNAQAVRITGLLQPQTALPGRLELRPYLRTSRMESLQHFLLGEPLERNGQESAGVMTTLDSMLDTLINRTGAGL